MCFGLPFDEIGATLFAGIMAALVGCVQALIYWRQSTLLRRANNQALFDSRFRLYKSISTALNEFLEYNGEIGSAHQSIIDDVEIAEFLFSKESHAHLEEIVYTLENLQEGDSVSHRRNVETNLTKLTNMRGNLKADLTKDLQLSPPSLFEWLKRKPSSDSPAP